MESAKSRLSICAEDVREQLEKSGNTPELCSQLGAVLGMLGDCWYVLSRYSLLNISIGLDRTISFFTRSYFKCV